MEKTDAIKEITKYAKRLSPEQQKTLLDQLRLAQLLSDAQQFDEDLRALHKKNKTRPPSMKEIVEVVYKVRSERKKKHAA